MPRDRISDFERSWKRTQRLMRVWFAFIAFMALSIIGFTVFSIYTVVSDPGVIGEMVAKVEQGYERENGQ